MSMIAPFMNNDKWQNSNNNSSSNHK